MRYIVLLTLIAGCAAEEKCAILDKESYFGYVKNAPPALVAAVEKHLKAKMPEDVFLDKEVYLDNGKTTVFLIVYGKGACAPVPSPGTVPIGPQPAVITLYTNAAYNAARSSYYTTVTKSMLQQAVQLAGLPYVESMYQITLLNSNGYAAVQIRISSVDCVALPLLVSQAKNFLVTSATYQCGNGPVTQV